MEELFVCLTRVVQAVNFFSNSPMQSKICDGWSLLFHVWLDGAVSEIGWWMKCRCNLIREENSQVLKLFS